VSQSHKSNRFSASIITQEIAPDRGRPRIPIHMFGFEVPHHQDRKSRPKHADRSDPIVGREGDTYTVRTLNVPLANIICMAVVCSWVKARTGTA
jgi:hypothetical protein